MKGKPKLIVKSVDQFSLILLKVIKERHVGGEGGGRGKARIY